jgi:glyoxylase-like metal-dependent hydrolase (beta-lactamase superfamily II)
MPQTPIQIVLPMWPEAGPVNVYLFTSPEVVLIDTGPAAPQSWSALVEGLARQGVEAGDIARVVVTHPHHDHYAQAGRIAEAGRAQVWMADVGAHWLLDAEASRSQRVAYYRDVFFPGIGLASGEVASAVAAMEGLFGTITAVPRERVTTFAAGETLVLGGLPWEVLHVPGHSTAQTCFYQAQTRQLLASDMLLPITPTPVVDAPRPGAPRQPALPQFMASLARVEALEIARVYPGHGDPFDDHRSLIQAQRARIEVRKQECLDQIRAGRRTVVDLHAAMYGGGDAWRAGIAAIWMLVGYTDLLLAEGRIEAETRNGVWTFHATG